MRVEVTFIITRSKTHLIVQTRKIKHRVQAKITLTKVIHQTQAAINLAIQIIQSITHLIQA